MLLLALTDDFKVWEHRIGSFFKRCPRCGQDAWQLAFRLYRNQGTLLSPPSAFTPPIAERYQVRCCACACPSPAAHPAMWVQSLGVPFQQENYPPVPAFPNYAAFAFSQPF